MDWGLVAMMVFGLRSMGTGCDLFELYQQAARQPRHHPFLSVISV